jgi:hypothetical protein
MRAFGFAAAGKGVVFKTRAGCKTGSGDMDKGNEPFTAQCHLVPKNPLGVHLQRHLNRRGYYSTFDACPFQARNAASLVLRASRWASVNLASPLRTMLLIQCS